MTEDPQDQEYLDLFTPKANESAADTPGTSEPSLEMASGPTEPVDTEPSTAQPDPWESTAIPVQPLTEDRGAMDSMIKSVGAIIGGGCLLLMLLAVVAFAFYQVFVRRGGDEEAKAIPTATVSVAATPVPTAVVAGTPEFEPLVSSTDVRVPLALPERLTIGESVFSVQAVETRAGSWPAVPPTVDTANWAYGAVVNYILSLAPMARNTDLVSSLAEGDTLSLYLSTGLILNFSVREVTTGAPEDAALFDQISPRLTVGVLTEDAAQRLVVTAAFQDEEAQDMELFSDATIGLVGTPIQQDSVRVTVLEVYQVASDAAGLPPGTGYLLMDVTVENVGTTVLEPNLFLAFVADTTGKRYPLTKMAEQFSHYGVPSEPLAPGETVIGSLGYLVPDTPEREVRWFFNPVPGGGKTWVVVPLSYELPPTPPPVEPSPAAGFAVVTVAASDVFVNKDDGLLDIVLRIENPSAGLVTITQDDISLSTWTDGEITLVAPAPQLPWTIEPGELRLFQLQFQLPSADSALLTVQGYTYSIENLGGE